MSTGILDRIKTAYKIITTGDLQKIYIKNSTGDFFYESNDAFFDTKIADFKAFYLSKFKFNVPGGEIRPILLNEWLWTLGRVAIIKLKGADKDKNTDYLLCNFAPLEWDFNREITKIKAIPLIMGTNVKTTLKESYVVNKDAVIFNAGAGFYINQRQYFTPLYKVIALMNELSIVQAQILQNTLTGRSVLKIPANSDKKYIKEVRQAILSGDVIIKAGQNVGDLNMDKENVLEFVDRTENLLKTYNHYFSLIEDTLGISSNSNPDKLERQTNVEININNVISDSINEIELAYRKESCDLIKKVFGWDITVSLSKSLQAEDKGDENETRRQ